MRKNIAIATAILVAAFVFTPGCRDFDTPGAEEILNTGSFLYVEVTQSVQDVYAADLATDNATFNVSFQLQGANADEDPQTDVTVYGYTIHYVSGDSLAPVLTDLSYNQTTVVRTDTDRSWDGLPFASATQGQDYTSTATTEYTAIITFDCESYYGYQFEVVIEDGFFMHSGTSP